MKVSVRPSSRRWLASVVALFAAATSVGCASARIKKENALALASADAKVLDGCYGCLHDARRVYERLTTGQKGKNSSGIVARLFESDILIALREKEMGLDSRAAMERARSLVPRVPATLEPERVLALADHVMPDGNAYPLRVSEARLRSYKPFVDKLDAELAWIEQAPLTPAVRTYIALAADCSYPDRYKQRGDTTNPLEKRREVPINAPPVVAYRAANCAKTDTLALKRVLAAVPQFDEAAYALGNVVVWFAGETGGDDARKYYASAYSRFPGAAGLTFMSGWLNLNIGDCQAAIRYYDETVAIEPAHDRAILQKAICQSNLHEDSAVIATTTRFIALETPDMAQGYYWRAISRLRRRELDMARSDIELAKARSRGAEILTAAGIIEYEQSDFTVAETDLRGARTAPKGDENCNAGFYLGSVFTKREAWAEAAASYDSAMVCYDDKSSVIAAKIEQVRRSTRGTPEFRSRRIAALESDLADRRKRSQTSAFNAASMNARLGNFGRAEELLAVAAQSAELTDQIAKLREQLAVASRPATPAAARQRSIPPRLHR
jgi:tetratricopeptide (TPR) repeat protein